MTRVILVNGHEGHEAAGKVVAAFGEFVIGGNYVVGFIIFAILMIINFIVVTKGAGRVSEVNARFTLDAMPRHRVQGETRIHFRHTSCTFGHHDEVDDHQNRKDDETDHIVAADHKFTEGGHHLASSLVTFVAIDQNDARHFGQWPRRSRGCWQGGGRLR